MILVTFLLVNTLVSISLIAPAKASGTIYIHSDGSIDPSGSPISTQDTVTYALTGEVSASIIVERSGIVIDGNGHTVEGDGTDNGFTVSSVNSVTIKNTKIENFNYGIYIELASSTVVLNNNITANGYDGIGIFDSSNTIISGNSITWNGYDGIENIGSSHSIFSGNQIVANAWFGIGIYDSSNINVTENRVRDNYNGIELSNAMNSRLFLNDFMNHTFQVSVVSSTAVWDNARQGNYWSDYNGTDANGDDIGDTPYVVDENNVDSYPLMYIYWNPCDINHDLVVNMKDIAVIAKAFNTVPGNPGWNPHADITGTVPFVPDGKVDMKDIGLAAKNFMKQY